MGLRLRASLLIRTAVASCTPFTSAPVVGVPDGGLGLVLAEPLQLVVTRLASLSRVSAVVPSPPAAVAAAGLAVDFVPSAGGQRSGHILSSSARCHGRPPGVVIVVAAVLGCLYTMVARPSVPAGLLLLAVAFGGLAVWAAVREVRRRISGSRPRVVADNSPLKHTPNRRSSRRSAGWPSRPAYRSRPSESLSGDRIDDRRQRGRRRSVDVVRVGRCAPGSGARPSGRRRQSGDGRSPRAGAGGRRVYSGGADLEDRFWNLVFKLPKRYGQFGVAVPPRGRERAADVAAAELTRSPAALAGTLKRLTEARDRPETDLREWKRSVTWPWASCRRRNPASRPGRPGSTRRSKRGSNTSNRRPNPPRRSGDGRLSGDT